MAKNIRLGIVRADTHAYYYGSMLAECDPLLLQKNDYVCHHYASNIYNPKILTFPKIPGVEIVKIYDYEPEKAQRFSETFFGKPIVCETVSDMVEGIEAVFIANCDGGGGDHLKLAEPFLSKKIPTFVDKPFASTLRDAKEIVRLAEENNTPLFNASILTYVPAATRFKRRFEEISSAYWPVPIEIPSAGIGLGVIKGVGGAFSQELSGKTVIGGIEERMAYIIHGVSLALNLFGLGVEWVEAMGTLPLEYLHLHMKAGVEIIILNTSVDIFPETCAFYASAYSKYGVVHSQPIGDPEFIGGAQRILEMFKQMLETGQPPVNYSVFLEHIAVVEAGQLAQSKSERVYIKDIWK
ncbi:MAG: Gfo/Idh/MocA family oxidoreductase [Planctomycetota bacterium]